MKLHRCDNDWVTCDGHPCWRVQTALDAAGVEYEIVRHPAYPRTARTDLIALTGKRSLPVLELDDGTILDGDSRELARLIAAGRLGAPAR